MKSVSKTIFTAKHCLLPIVQAYKTNLANSIKSIMLKKQSNEKCCVSYMFEYINRKFFLPTVSLEAFGVDMVLTKRPKLVNIRQESRIV